MKPSAPLAIAILGLALLPTVAGAAFSDQVDYGTKAAIAWNAGYTGEGQTIAVIDSGTDAGHNWFGGQVTSEACFATTGERAYRPTCPGSRNHGRRRAADRDRCSAPGTAAPPRWGWNITASGSDQRSRTTAPTVAGVVAGGEARLLGFRVGRRGIAPNADLMAINTFGVFPDAYPALHVPDLAAALRWINGQRQQRHIAAVNLSITTGSPKTDPDSLCRDRKGARKRSGHSEVRDAINELVANGVPVVAGAGNEYGTRVGFPACLPNVIAVGAINTDTGKRAASHHRTQADRRHRAGHRHRRSKTRLGAQNASVRERRSYAGPMIAAAIAMFKQKYPNATPAQIRGALKNTGLKKTFYRGGKGRLLQVDQFLGIKPAPTGKVNTSCIRLEFQAADNVSHKHDAFARLTCAPTATAPSKLVVRVAGPQIDESREYTNIPIAEPSYYANSLVRFGVPRFDSDPGSYRTCYTLYGTQDQLWPIASDCREDTVG